MAQYPGNGNLFSLPTNQAGSNPNFVTSTSDISFEYTGGVNVDQFTSVEAQTLVSGGGLATALASAAAVLIRDEAYSGIFASTTATGDLGTYNSIAQTEASVMGTFSLKPQETFGFNFVATDKQLAKEIEQPDREHNFAQQNTAFAILDITNPYRPLVIDHFAMQSKLESAKQRGNQRLIRSGNVRIVDRQEQRDINGNNGFDGLARGIAGTYERSFGQETRLAVVELVKSYAEAVGDTYIGNLGAGTIYGSLRNDNLYARSEGSRVYASYGRDRLNGQNGNDILEGSYGDDRLKGRDGNDKLHGGFDNDILDGGKGNDLLVGGQGSDTFTFRRSDFRANERDIVADFEIGTDRLEFRSFPSFNIEASSSIIADPEGAILKFNDQGEILFKGLSTSDLKRAISPSLSAQASFLPQDTDILARPDLKPAKVSFSAVENLEIKQGAANFESVTTNVRARPAVPGAQKLDDSAIIKELKIGENSIRFQGDAKEYDLQFVEQGNQALGTAITYKGSGDVTGFDLQNSITGDIFGAQVFGTSR